MRIGLLSDTHIPLDAEELPPQLRKAFQGVDLILHAGDIYRAYVLDELQTIAPVLAALGDDDPITLAVSQRAMKKHILHLGGLTLWLMHYGPDLEYFKTDYHEQDTLNTNALPDIVVFGHEHHTYLQEEDGVLLVNPGSPTFLHYQRGPGTVAILDITAGKATANIIPLSGIE